MLTVLSLSPLFAPLLLEVLRPTGPRLPARILVGSLLLFALGAVTFQRVEPLEAFAIHAAAAALVRCLGRRSDVITEILEVGLVSLLIGCALAGAFYVVSSPRLSLTTALSGLLIAALPWIRLRGDVALRDWAK